MRSTGDHDALDSIRSGTAPGLEAGVHGRPLISRSIEEQDRDRHPRECRRRVELHLRPPLCPAGRVGKLDIEEREWPPRLVARRLEPCEKPGSGVRVRFPDPGLDGTPQSDGALHRIGRVPGAAHLLGRGIPHLLGRRDPGRGDEDEEPYAARHRRRDRRHPATLTPPPQGGAARPERRAHGKGVACLQLKAPDGGAAG